MRRLVEVPFLREIHKSIYMWNRLVEWSVRDAEMMKFYSRFISNDSLCFDVGANYGNRTKVFLRLNARVIAVEPQSECLRVMKLRYRGNKRLITLQRALGENEGNAELMISNANTLSSLSPEWIRAVSTSGRFSEYTWGHKSNIRMTTLDSLIRQYGLPDFIKIDVEGYEHQVLKGLSQSVRFVSFEFTPELIESTFRCIDHLQEIGNTTFNYSLGESMDLALDNWVTSEEIKENLSNFRDDHKLFGDVYANCA